MDSVKYIGMDVHKEAISLAVLNSSGKLVMECIIETKASTILQFFQGFSGSLRVTFEEGTWAAWLYDLLKPHVTNLVVCNPRRNALLKEGSKSDRIDARKLAELLRSNLLRPVYHGEHGLRTLKELGRSYLTISKDLERVMSRLKATYTKLGNALHREARLCAALSLGMARQNRRSRRAPSSGVHLSTIRCVAIVAPGGAAQSAGRGCQTQRNKIVARDSFHRPDPGGAHPRDPANTTSFSHEAAALDLQWIWDRNAHQCRAPLCQGPVATLEEADLGPRVESKSQSRTEKSVQKCRDRSGS
jgi:hypothetical protein